MKECECGNCGSLVDIEEFEDGECERCGMRYIWEMYSDDDGYEEMIVVWLNI